MKRYFTAFLRVSVSVGMFVLGFVLIGAALWYSHLLAGEILEWLRTGSTDWLTLEDLHFQNVQASEWVGLRRILGHLYLWWMTPALLLSGVLSIVFAPRP